jgi:TetR/AcrR family transcriptional regulator
VLNGRLINGVPLRGLRRACAGRDEEIRASDITYKNILKKSAEIIALKGYEKASMREIAGAAGVSLAAPYYYFKNKETILFQIQKKGFEYLVENLKTVVVSDKSAEEKLRIFVGNHVRYFLSNRNEMKVIIHEYDVLSKEYQTQISQIKTEYTHLAEGILKDCFKEKDIKGCNSLYAIMILFGMMNWLYTWFRPRDKWNQAMEELIDVILNIFFDGIHHWESG